MSGPGAGPRPRIADDFAAIRARRDELARQRAAAIAAAPSCEAAGARYFLFAWTAEGETLKRVRGERNELDHRPAAGAG